jgi:peptidoglycan/xylan/chitin deacetylase (PgdA/CDA1 family)
MGNLVAEHRVHFPYECVAPGDSIVLRGSLSWAELSLPPGLYTVALDVVREGINWSRSIISSPQHPLIIPDTIYRVAYDLSRFHTTKRLSTLTFNAHGDNLYTADLLDILETLGVKATFFISGDYLRTFPELVDRMVETDHEIGNLTDTYQMLAYPGQNIPRQGISHQVVYDELMRVSEAFQKRYDKPLAPFWRAPHGVRNGPLLQYGTDLGLRHISWGFDGFGSRVGIQSIQSGEAARLIEEFLSQPLGRGSILGFNAASNHVQAPLYDIIQRIVEFGWSKGFSFRSCGEMIEEAKQHPLVVTYPRI